MNCEKTQFFLNTLYIQHDERLLALGEGKGLPANLLGGQAYQDQGHQQHEALLTGAGSSINIINSNNNVNINIADHQVPVNNNNKYYNCMRLFDHKTTTTKNYNYSENNNILS